MSYPFGTWVMIDRLPDEPVIAFVYLDPRAGPSAKGGLASDRELARMPARTIRLSPETPLRPLRADELAALRLPAQPDWLRRYGPQPAPDAPWHRDPLLAGHFHERYPDDVQALVHDGDPRRTRRGPELCWVRLLGVAGRVYVAELFYQPHTLTSVARGDRIKVLSVPGVPHPLHVTDEYLRERPQWTITPCNKCGATECFDPPSLMAHVRFPDAPKDTRIEAFTSWCSHCGGIQELRRVPPEL